MSNHRFFQLYNLVDNLEADARVNFRCAKNARAFFFARATKALRVANIAARRAGL